MPFGLLKRTKGSVSTRSTQLEAAILDILDRGCRDFVFPMLDNRYVYVAAARMSPHRSAEDWAIVFETFGFSPRSGAPDLSVWTFASRITNRTAAANYVDEDALGSYLRAHPNDDSAFFSPVGDGWQDPEAREFVARDATTLTVRGKEVAIPERDDLRRLGIEQIEPAPDRVRTFEVCRCLAAIERDLVLATPEERRTHVPADLDEILVLEDWHHPDTVTGQVASDTAAFRSIARVLGSADGSAYDPSEPGNTHWSNWPEGGSL